MNKPKLAFGLNLAKRPGASKPAPPRRKAMFDDDDDGFENESANRGAQVEEIGGNLDDFTATTSQPSDSTRGPRSRREPPKEPPKRKSKVQTNAMFGDLSSSLASRKNAEAAAELDASVYEYDSIYDSLKPKKNKTKEDEERKPKYMRSLMQASDVRKQDAMIAQEKKIAREREAEGEEFADTEKFVTGAYKKRQEENRRIEEEERRKQQEEEEARRNKGGGMSAFYRKLLDKDEQRHAETLKAAEEMAKGGPKQADQDDEEEDKEKAEARLAKELNEKGAAVAVNEDGQVVDKRQLLKGGLNLGAKKKEAVHDDDAASAPGSLPAAERQRGETDEAQLAKKQALWQRREREARMIAEQLEASEKRKRDEEEVKREEVGRANKSRKTEGDISGAREKYLARKRAAEEAKKAAAAAE